MYTIKENLYVDRCNLYVDTCKPNNVHEIKSFISNLNQCTSPFIENIETTFNGLVVECIKC